MQAVFDLTRPRLDSSATCLLGYFYSLHDMLQRMTLRLLKIITPIYRIKPTIQEEFSPLPISHNETTRRQTIFILRDDEVYSVALQVAKGFDDAVGGYDGRVCYHEAFEFRGREQRGVEGERGVHDQRCVVEVPDELRGGEEDHGVADGGDAGPGAGGGAEGVLVVCWEEGLVACEYVYQYDVRFMSWKMLGGRETYRVS
jgi:hypothetical protein